MSLTEYKQLYKLAFERQLSREERDRLQHLASTLRQVITINPGPLEPTGKSYDRWQKKALWAISQIVMNPDANHWTVIAAEIEEAVEESHRTAMDECSACGGRLDVIGTYRCSDGKGGMKHTNPEDCE